MHRAPHAGRAGGKAMTSTGRRGEPKPAPAKVEVKLGLRDLGVSLTQKHQQSLIGCRRPPPDCRARSRVLARSSTSRRRCWPASLVAPMTSRAVTCRPSKMVATLSQASANSRSRTFRPGSSDPAALREEPARSVSGFVTHFRTVLISIEEERRLHPRIFPASPLQSIPPPYAASRRGEPASQRLAALLRQSWAFSIGEIGMLHLLGRDWINPRACQPVPRPRESFPPTLVGRVAGPPRLTDIWGDRGPNGLLVD